MMNRGAMTIRPAVLRTADSRRGAAAYEVESDCGTETTAGRRWGPVAVKNRLV